MSKRVFPILASLFKLMDFAPDEAVRKQILVDTPKRLFDGA
jgi:hypothetical protein